MKLPIFSYRDRLAGFGSPILDISEQTAIRGFSMKMNNPDSMENFSPKDFELYKIGIFDADTGKITPEEIPVLICEGVNVIVHD